jgi:3-deoxy-D-manno-octulosonic-acid transferase
MSGHRFGRYEEPTRLGSPVWVHAVSLGEVRAAQPFIEAILAQGDQVLLTHMTATGRAEGARMFARAIQAGCLQQAWLPYDFPGSVRRFLAHFQPCVGVLIEREVWPNIIAQARRMRIPLLLASARFSDNSLRQTLRLGSVMREAYQSLQVVYAQTLQDAQRLEQAGVVGVRVSGNFKFDVSLSGEHLERGRAFAQALSRKMITIASTREGEDELFIQAIQKQARRAQLQGVSLDEHVLFCLIPRHPQRFDEVAKKLGCAGLSYMRRSAFVQTGETDAVNARIITQRRHLVLLGDSLGEMPRYYAASDVAIVAGSFLPFGGQNLIEACASSVPVLVGPHTENFDQAVFDAIQEGAALRVPTAEAAIQQALTLLDEPQRLARMAQAGAQWVSKHTGAVARVLIGLNELKAKNTKP